VLPGGSLLQNSLVNQGQLRFSLNYEYEFLTDPIYGTRSIPNINRERTNNTTTSIFASYGVSDHLGLTMVVPFRMVTNEKLLLRGQNDNQYDGGKYIRQSSGLGDIVILANYTPPFSSKLLGLAIGAGVKLANGSIDAKDKFGERFSDNLQIGTGSVDPVFSLTMSHAHKGFAFSALLFTRISIRDNIYGYKYGNELHSILSVDYQEHELVYGGIDLNHLHTTRDRYQYGKITRERGGQWLMLAPKLGINLTSDLSVDLRIPLSLYQNVNESQLTSKYQIQVSTAYKLAL
jgi:hypothetical protein